MPKTKLAIITTHPIQYLAPVFRELASCPTLTLRVFYTWSQTQAGLQYEPEFHRSIRWDIPLLDGYDSCFAPNLSARPGSDRFWGIRNPSLISLVDEWRPDAVLVIGWNFASHLRAICHFHGRIPVLFRGDSTLLDQRSPARTLLRRLVLRAIYSQVDKAVSVGSNNYDYYRWCGLSPDQIVFAPHSIDTKRFRDSDGCSEILAVEKRRLLGIADDHCVLLYAGKFIEKKAPLFLLETFLSTVKNDGHLLFVGNGPLEGILRERAHGKHNVHFLPFQNQSVMPAIYRVGDVFTLPSQGPGETWGLAMNEALACGRPVIASSIVGGARDMITPGETGWIFRARDGSDLSSVLKRATTIGRTRLHEMGNLGQIRSGRWDSRSTAEALAHAVL